MDIYAARTLALVTFSLLDFDNRRRVQATSTYAMVCVRMLDRRLLQQWYLWLHRV